MDRILRYLGISKTLDTAIRYLVSNDLTQLHMGRNEIDGDDVFVNMAVEEKTLMVLPESTNIYQSTAQWQDFGVINGAATSVEEVEVAAELQAHFEQYDLVVSSSQAMAEVRLYNVSGVLLSLATPHATHVAIDTRHLVDNVYLLFVTTADGRQQVTKLARIIR